MPKSKQKSNKSSESEVSSSQASSSQAASQYSQADVDRRVSDLVKFLLIMDQKKLPIKKQDINKHVLKELSRAGPVVLDKAKFLLRDVFGIELVELEDKQKGNYILVNSLETDATNPHLQWPGEDNAKFGLIIVILSLIFMNGNVISDGEMWHGLKRLGVEPEVSHTVFGDIKKLVTSEFVKQGYIEYNKRPNSDPPVYDFKWGWRAREETSKKHVLDFVSQVYSMDPKQWTSQWQDVVQTEGIEDEV
ncbi:non-structural maintenance of chromosomes element 3 homolog [Liolophura sinensis]|uniref:non-structural maintenance of chromosomes element 3 homolog n=1 Tax=Liolophura sinensis TaxID=3198878 RepID=UPI003158C29F